LTIHPLTVSQLHTCKKWPLWPNSEWLFDS